MKPALLYTFIVAALSSMCSCASHDAVLYSLTLPKTEMIIDSGESTFNVTVYGNAEYSAVVQGASWIEVTDANKNGSNTIAMRASANTSDSPRSATLAVTNLSSQETLAMKILQAAASDLFFDEEWYALFSHGYEFKLRQPQASLYSVEPSDSWIKVEKTADPASGINVTTLVIEKNEGDAERTASVRISSDTGSRTVSVAQKGRGDHLYLGVVHSSRILAPRVIDGTNHETKVDWGDGQKGSIEDDGHIYSSDGTHNAVIDCYGVKTLAISTIGTATELTFGRRK